MKDLTGKVVLLTGGAQGLGAEFACSFAGYGAKVVIADWKDAGSTIERVERNGGEAWARKVDVRDATHLDSLVKEIIAVYGRVDVLVNCAAIAVDLNMKPFYEIDREDWQRVKRLAKSGISYTPGTVNESILSLATPDDCSSLAAASLAHSTISPCHEADTSAIRYRCAADNILPIWIRVSAFTT